MTADEDERGTTPELRLVFASWRDNDYLVAELWMDDDVMVGTVQWRDDALVVSWLSTVDLSSLEVASVLSSAHQRLIDNRVTLDRRGSLPK